MVSKLLAWTALLLTLVFVGITLTAAFALDWKDEDRLLLARKLFYFGAIPSLGLALLLAFVLLVMAAFQPKD